MLQASGPLPQWNTDRINNERLAEELSVSRVTSAIVRACDASLPRSGNRNRCQPTYWWTEEIAELRRACLTLRRRAQRAQERRGASAPNAKFKQAQKRLRLVIKASNRRCWKEVCDEVNSDPWGLGYRIVTRRIEAIKLPEIKDARLINGAPAERRDPV